MRKAFFGVLFLQFVIGVSAQTVRVHSGNSGNIFVTKGRLRRAINLSKNVAGCAYIPNQAMRYIEKDCSAPPADFKLVDAVTKNNQTFLIVQSDAMGNCNVCGFCGASESFTLIWLKLDAQLKVLEEKGLPIQSCSKEIALLIDAIDFNEKTQDETLKLKFAGDILTVEFEKTLFGENAEISGYEFSHLEYDRKTPENGFVIKTESRPKSSAKEN